MITREIKLIQIDISKIKVKDRIRKDLGDMKEIINSIKVIGLLNPITIDQNNNLIAGERRLISCKMLGFNTIAARVINITHANEALLIEEEENIARKSFNNEEVKKLTILKYRRSRRNIFKNLKRKFLEIMYKIIYPYGKI